MTRPTMLSGIVPPVVTPLTEHGEVDVASLERLVGFLLDAGVDGLFLLGSSAEVAYLTDQQRATVLKVATAVAGRQVPVLAGVIDMTTARVVAQARTAVDHGVDGVVATAPFYVRTHSTEIDRHFRDLAAAIDLPVYAYDVPVAVHTKLDPQSMLRLGSDGVLAGVKDSSGDDVAFRRLVIGARQLPRFSVLTGHEVLVDSCLLIGADGAVPGLANVDPDGYVRLAAAAAAGDWATARAEQERLALLFSIVDIAPPTRVSRSAAGLGAFKTALAHRGVIAGSTMAAPMEKLNVEEAASIRQVLLDTDLLPA